MVPDRNEQQTDPMNEHRMSARRGPLQLIRPDAPAEPPAGAFRMSCVVPAFNEAAGIAGFLEALRKSIESLTADYEIIVVNDGSTDGSREKILHSSVASRVRYVELSRNFGKEAAIQAGLDLASGECTVILDADFQHPPELIQTMVQRWCAGVHMVYAVRRDRRGEGWIKRTAVAAFYRILSHSRDPEIPANAGDFRLLDRRVVHALRALPERDRFMKGLYAWVGFRSEPVEYTPAARRSGQTRFGALRLASLAATGLTSFSNLPLRWVAAAGALISTSALCMSCWLVLEKIFLGQPIAGFATLGAAIFFFSGIQLLALGIVGEYVGRIFNEVKQRPRYLVAEDSGAVATVGAGIHKALGT